MQESSRAQFMQDFSRIICDVTANKVYSNVLFLCVGTDKIVGDSFGPIVGYMLKELFMGAKNIDIIGDLEKIVSDSNIEDVMNEIVKLYSNPFIVAIDSAISGKEENIGKIIVSSGGICLGQGLGKNRYYIGDMSIKGIVAKNLGTPMKNLANLKATSLGLVLPMADVVSKGIYNCIDYEC